MPRTRAGFGPRPSSRPLEGLRRIKGDLEVRLVEFGGFAAGLLGATTPFEGNFGWAESLVGLAIEAKIYHRRRKPADCARLDYG